MKKFVSLLMAALLLISLLSVASAEEVVNLFNWYDYMDPAVLDLFTEETGIKVNCMYFTENEDMMIALRTSPGSYDVVVPSDYCVERMIKEGLIQEINFENVPNFTYIREDLRNADYDPEGKFTVPFMWGTLGILFDTNKVSAEDASSWKILWDEQYADQIFMMLSLRDAMLIGLKLNGYSANSTDIKELNDAKNSLLEQKPLVKAYYVDETKDAMIKGEAALAVVYSGDALYAMDGNEDLDYVVPVEGSNIWIDPLVIPADAKNKENAEKLIDFLCRPEIAQMNCEYIFYSSPNQGAIDLMGEEYTENETINPSDEVIARCEFYHDLDDKTLNLYNTFWDQVKNAK